MKAEDIAKIRKFFTAYMKFHDKLSDYCEECPPTEGYLRKFIADSLQELSVLSADVEFLLPVTLQELMAETGRDSYYLIERYDEEILSAEIRSFTEAHQIDATLGLWPMTKISGLSFTDYEVKALTKLFLPVEFKPSLFTFVSDWIKPFGDTPVQSNKTRTGKARYAYRVLF